MENERSNRRRFVRKLVSLAALSGITGLLLGERLEKVTAISNAVTTSTSNIPGQLAFWDGQYDITGSDHLRWDDTARNFVAGYSGNIVWPDPVGVTISGGGASGFENKVTDNYGTVGGGWNNQAGNYDGSASNAAYATVGGGNSNAASGGSATIGGGESNSASDNFATVSGGVGNSASKNSATVGGGYGNTASWLDATVGGGYVNTASGDSSTVGGGQYNAASNVFSTVGGGTGNAASNIEATVGGGVANTASNIYATVGGGISNTSSGDSATVPGGSGNIAAGDYSFAAGRRAKIDALHDGSFLFSDSSNFDFNSSAANEFAVRATGGARFVPAIDGTGAPIKSFVMTPAGNLGVGTGSPLYACDIRTPGSTAAQMHFASTNTDAGGYFVSANDGNFYVSGGAAYNGTSWIAKAASAYIIGGDASGIRFYHNTALTAGSPFSPTLRMKIDPSGRFGIGTAAPTEKLHVVGKVRATQGFITGDITFANGYKLTEDKDSGLLLINEDGERIARFDHEGNLRIKGKIIEET